MTPAQTDVERHAYANLVLMCPTHHTVIDDDEDAYKVERLCKIKAKHEAQSAPIPDAEAAALAQVFTQSVANIGQSGGLSAHTVNASTITVQKSLCRCVPTFALSRRYFYRKAVERASSARTLSNMRPEAHAAHSPRTNSKDSARRMLYKIRQQSQSSKLSLFFSSPCCPPINSQRDRILVRVLFRRKHPIAPTSPNDMERGRAASPRSPCFCPTLQPHNQ
jgi:hypothetical protein